MSLVGSIKNAIFSELQGEFQKRDKRIDALEKRLSELETVKPADITTASVPNKK